MSLVVFRSAAPALAFASFLTACGAGETGPPPLPERYEQAVPELPGWGFRLGIGRPAERRAWLLAGEEPEPWFWLGVEDGPSRRVSLGASKELPEPATSTALYPAGVVLAEGRPRSLIRALVPDLWPFLEGIPALMALRLASLPPPEDEATAWWTALGISQNQALVRFLAALLQGRLEGALLEEGPSLLLDLRLRPEPALSSVPARAGWVPEDLPEGLGFVRLQLPAAVLLPAARAWIDDQGFLEAAHPAGDYVVEGHLLVLDGEFGFLIALPRDWAPPPGDWTRSFAAAFAAGVQTLPPELGVPALSARILEHGNSHLWSFGSPVFQAALRESLTRRRPPPFAGRRPSWLGAGLFAHFDLRTLQQQAASRLPVRTPSFLSRASARAQIAEFLVWPEGGGLRVHARWPRPESLVEVRGLEAVDLLGGRWPEQWLLDLLRLAGVSLEDLKPLEEG